ncbi:unnamed protein product [Miscanthus lutarioriparius]|uniref:DUF7597 domain-containing protein n=1 Tax=Miscanthus lutarioriparius TaxID=422564 RepID=A0A811N8I0_9POAL|nr:unnamed protein product [Miscanthus lutarioriparius]
MASSSPESAQALTVAPMAPPSELRTHGSLQSELQAWQVGFHIYNLRSFECQSFKILFNLWHGGGPNYAAEFRRWEAEEQAQWTDVAYRKRPPTEEKTPIATMALTSSQQSEMAFRFIDPAPLMVVGAQRQMINGRPLMRRVVVGHVTEQNNDLDIAILNPLPQGPINFLDIRSILEDFLHNHVNVGYRGMQPCPHGQAFIRFNYLLERDLLIQNSPHQYEGTNFESHSWTVQCEVLHTQMLGQAPQDEDLPPDDDDFDPNAFFYHGFGQFEAPLEAPVVEAPEPDPLPAVEEVLQAQPQNIEPIEEANVDQGEVLAMDDVTDSDDEFLQPPAPLVQSEVQVNISVVQNPQAWIVDEVPLEDLLGFMETFIPPVDPSQLMASSSKGPSAAAVRCWAKYFSPIDRSKPTVTIPTEWMDFFSLLLLKPGSFEWAKDFLTSPAWAALSKMSTGNSYLFFLPKSSPSVVISDYSCSEPPEPFCLDIEEIDEADGSEKEPAEESATAEKENRLAGKQPMNTTQTEQGVVTPPPSTIAVSTPRAKRVRDLGASFCKLDPVSLTEESLNAKPPKKKPVSKPKAKKAKKAKKDGADADGARPSNTKKK